MKAKGVILPSASGCTVFPEHLTSDRDLTAQVNTCEHTGTATLFYQGVTYTLTHG